MKAKVLNAKYKSKNRIKKMIQNRKYLIKKKKIDKELLIQRLRK